MTTDVGYYTEYVLARTSRMLHAQIEVAAAFELAALATSAYRAYRAAGLTRPYPAPFGQALGRCDLINNHALLMAMERGIA